MKVNRRKEKWAKDIHPRFPNAPWMGQCSPKKSLDWAKCRSLAGVERGVSHVHIRQFADALGVQARELM